MRKLTNIDTQQFFTSNQHHKHDFSHQYSTYISPVFHHHYTMYVLPNINTINKVYLMKIQYH